MDKEEKIMHNDSLTNEIDKVIKRLVTFEKNDKIKKLLSSEKEEIWFHKFINSDDYFLVKEYGINDNDRFLIYQILLTN